MQRAFLVSLFLHLSLLLTQPRWIPLLQPSASESGGSLQVRLIELRSPRSPNEVGVTNETSGLATGSDLLPKVPGASRGKSWMRQLPGSVGLLPVPEVVNPMPRPGFGGRDRQSEVEAPSVDAEELRSYRFAVARAAGHFKRYPEVARQRGWEGVVTVAVSLSPTGPQPTVSLARSSGYDVLDRQALEMLDAALRQVMLPPSLKGQAYVFSVPVRYALGE